MRVSVIVALACVVAGSLAAALLLRLENVDAAAGISSASSATASPRPTGELSTAPNPKDAPVTVDVNGEWAWALRDVNTNVVVGSGTLRNTTESMIKSWLAVDYIASQDSRISPADEDPLTRMIRVSDDHAAQTLYLRLGGDDSITRMIGTCGLRDTLVYHSWWSKTTMPATDATLLGACVARGPGLSAQWRGKLLDLMRSVDPSNAFGIPEAPALADRHLAVKNGWTRHGDSWAVNCLAIWDRWVLAVMVRYPNQGDEHRYGARVCASVAQQLFGGH